MSRKNRYRCLVVMFLCLDLAVLGWLGFKFLDWKVPDEIYVTREDSQEVTKLLKRPFLTFEDAIEVSGKGGYDLKCRLLGVIPFKDVHVVEGSRQSVYVSGGTVGIYMETKGVLVVDTGEIETQSGTTEVPAGNIVKAGDYIVAFNGKKITDKQQLIRRLSDLNEEKVTLKVQRNGKILPLSLTPVKDTGGKYKLGLWVRDDTQGIGTLTFVDENGKFGALGHGISDIDTGELLNIRDGSLYGAQIMGIKKGTKGSPGELTGLICYDEKNVIGSVSRNCESGIYGNIDKEDINDLPLKKMKIGYKQEMKTGPASILCCVDGTVKEYAAEITRIDMNREDTNKSFVIKITDQELLEKTGGIVQGMSGSPVIQNGCVMGAVTHVFVQDSAGGYGIFIENMLKKV